MRHPRASIFPTICLAIIIAASAGLFGCSQTARPVAQTTAATSQVAQPPAPAATPEPPPALASKPGYTQLAVMVTDSKGTPVLGLKESDFAVSSGGKSVPIGFFVADKGAVPMSIVLVIDTSGSMHPKLDIVRQEIRGLVAKLNQHDEIALFAFSNHPFLLQPLTTDHQLVLKRLHILYAYGQTAIYDSLDESLKTLKGAKYHDRAIVLITDGMDNMSRLSEHYLIAEIKRNAVPIYAVGIGDRSSSAGSGPVIVFGPLSSGPYADSVDKRAIRAITSASGGKAFFVPLKSNNGKDSAAAVNEIADLLNGSYEIGFVTKSRTPRVIVKKPSPSHRACRKRWTAAGKPYVDRLRTLNKRPRGA